MRDNVIRSLRSYLCVVQNCVKSRENYGKLKSTSRPKILTTRETRAISRMASNSIKSVAKIKKVLYPKASIRTILSSINAQPHIVRSKLKKCRI